MLSLLHAVVLSSHHLVADTPTPGNATLPGNTETQLNTVLGWIKYLGLAACVAGLFLVAAKMAISHRTDGGGAHLSGLGYIAAALVIIGGATSIVSLMAGG